ncbi:MAG: 3-deoxy-D-manno-octulosonic acid transferase [Leptospira sp.]|nr:3-deoxy-D-manno-octulosonic acid transferase [Leptospira sp.]
MILPFFSKRAKSFLEERKQDRLKIINLDFDPAGKRVIWFHAASVGELDQCKALANVLHEKEPETIILQSTFSESVTNKNLQGHVSFLNFRLPVDFYSAYDFIFNKFKPEILILMAWDTWPNLIMAAKRHQTRVYLACATLNESSRRKGFLAGMLTNSIFSKLDGISPANEIFSERFRKLTNGSVRITSCGDSRFDSVIEKIENSGTNSRFNRLLEKYPWKKKVIFASTYSACEKILFPAIPDIPEDTGIWIFPHKISDERINDIKTHLDSLKIEYTVYSKFQDGPLPRTVIFDVLGILAFAYREATIAYIGGGIHNRVHNVIEPAYFGLPVLTGPKIHNSPEAQILLKFGGLFTCNTENEFRKNFLYLLSNNGRVKKINSENRQFVKTNRGASLRFYQEFLNEKN